MPVSLDMKSLHTTTTTALSIYTFRASTWTWHNTNTYEEAAITCAELTMVMRSAGRLAANTIPIAATPALRVVARSSATCALIALSEYRLAYRREGRLWVPVSEWRACESGACEHESVKGRRISA